MVTTDRIDATLRPARVSHPGVIVRRELNARRGWDTVTLAKRADLPSWIVSALMDGEWWIGPGEAAGLARAFGTSPDVWLNMQREYDAWKEAQHG